MNFGPQTSEPDSYQIMDHALDAGINFFDTANVYGKVEGEGVTEQIIGRWLAQGGKRREKIVLATKVFGRMGQGVNEQHLSAYHIMRACEESLRRLQTDHIDLYQMHHIDNETPWDEIWQAMETLVQQGKVIYIGSSNFAAWNIVQAQETAKKRNFFGLVSEQSHYNLLTRTIELEVIPACRAYGIGLIPWSPLAGGRLGGILEKGKLGRRSKESLQQEVENNREKYEAYEQFCREIGEAPADVALAWVLQNPAVTSPIIGPRTLEQLQGNLHSLDVKLSNEMLKQLDSIFPGPGGEAPKPYAW
jgi:aryl-alcohol dehydrogenase-like predicted oxidoreductase